MTRKTFKPFASLTLSLLLLGFAAPSSFAGFYDFVTPTGASTAGGGVNADVAITTGAGTISITLSNLQANPTDVAQGLSDLSFTLGNGYTSGTSSLASSSGMERTINSNGTYTDGPTVSTGWILSASGTTFTLDDLAPGGAGPTHLIIGGPDGSNLYSNAKGSIAGNKAHNPFLANSATFTITAANVTSSTTVTGTMFSFGTTSGVNILGTPAAVPEPATVISTLSGLLMVGGAAWRRRRRAA